MNIALDLFLAIILPIVVVGGLVVLLAYYITKRTESLASQMQSADKGAEGPPEGPPQDSPAAGPAEPQPTATSAPFQIIPRDYDKRIEYWDDTWQFAQPDYGKVEFDVTKESGLIVTISSKSGYPKDGYAVIFDQRGGADTNLSDTTTSRTYVSRLPNINGAVSSHANVRNVELAGVKRHIEIVHDHGYTEVFVDGKSAVFHNDPFPTTGLSFIGFGHLGIKSGVGTVQNLKIY